MSPSSQFDPKQTNAACERTRKLDWLGALLLASSFVSAAIGFGYALFYAAPALRSAVAEGHAVGLEAGSLVAALTFASAQVVAIRRILEARPVFFVWLAPAALYLFGIGAVGWLRSGDILALWLDCARGLWLLALGGAHLRTLQRAKRA